MKNEKLDKVKVKSWNKLVSLLKGSKFYPFLYRSYWHSLFNKGKSDVNMKQYYAARPNPGAGIGHQLANWIAGYWFAQKFNLNFAHIPFSTKKWEDFLGFGENETSVLELLNQGYKLRRLPLFDENNKKGVALNKRIIASYRGTPVVFLAEQDQFYMEQFGVIPILKQKFNSAKARHKDVIVFDPERFNIAVHVRRTVIIDSKVIVEDETQRAKRWLSNDYYEKVLEQVLKNISLKKPVSIYIFSTGKAEEFSDFEKYGDVKFCSDMDEYASFLHLIKADLLITSKSSFSYKSALMNNGIKVCPRNFWHGYPTSKDWIMVENDGTFNIVDLI